MICILKTIHGEIILKVLSTAGSGFQIFREEEKRSVWKRPGGLIIDIDAQSN